MTAEPVIINNEKLSKVEQKFYSITDSAALVAGDSYSYLFLPALNEGIFIAKISDRIWGITIKVTLKAGGTAISSSDVLPLLKADYQAKFHLSSGEYALGIGVAGNHKLRIAMAPNLSLTVEDGLAANEEIHISFGGIIVLDKSDSMVCELTADN